MKKRDLRPAARKISPGPGKLATPDSAKWRRMRHGKPPSNLELPTISGTALEDEPLTADPGVWTGDPSYTYQWFSDGVAIVEDATEITYYLTQGEVGTDITVAVTATNANGSTTAVSASTAEVAELPPTNTVAPDISGTPNVGETLTASNGSWTQDPTFTYQWTADGVDIGGATASTFLITSTQAGALIRVRVTGTNPAGNASATSSPTTAVAWIPINTVLPVITGTTTETWTLTASTGTWTGYPAPTYTYQWKRGGVDIGSATASTYELTDADVGTVITVAVTGTNTAGNATATSAGTAAIAAAPSPVVVQDNGDQTSSAVTSDTATFGGVTVNGRGIVVSFSIKSTPYVVSVTDNKGNVYERVGRQADGTDCSVEMWWTENIVGGASHIITVTYSAAASAVWGAVELSGTKTTGTLDAGSINTSTTGGVNSGTVTVTSNPLASRNELIVAAMALAGGGAAAGITNPAGFTEYTLFNNYSSIMAGHGATKEVKPKTAVTASWPNSTTTARAAAIIAGFRANGATESVVARNSTFYVETARHADLGINALTSAVYAEVVRSEDAGSNVRASAVYVEVIRSIT